MAKLPTDPYIRELDKIHRYGGVASVRGATIPTNYPFERILKKIVIDHHAGRKKHYPRFLILTAKLCESHGIDWDEKFIREIAEDFFYVDIGGLSTFYTLCGVVNIACVRHNKLNRINLKSLPGANTRRMKAVSLIKLKQRTKIKDTIKEDSYMIYARKFLEQQNLLDKLLPAIEEINKNLLSENSNFYVGRNPRVIAAALIYIASIKNPSALPPNVRLTQRDICGVLNITEVSLRNTYKHLNRVCGEEKHGISQVAGGR